MILLVTQAMPQMRRHAHPNLGRLVTPRHFCSIEEHGELPAWAADNDCFQGLDADAFHAMLDAMRFSPTRPLFVTVPDVVSNALETAAQFDRWAPALEARGLPLALVLQDGIEQLASSWLPDVWPRLSAVFVGGSTEFKLGHVARQLVAEAKRRGLWAHMGRVNSARRIMYAQSIGCDSIDGTQWVTWRARYLDEGLALVGRAPQMRLELAA
jgi:hypothetical protein